MYEARVVMLLDVPDGMNFEDFKEYAIEWVKDYFQKELKKGNYKVEVDDDWIQNSFCWRSILYSEE